MLTKRQKDSLRTSTFYLNLFFGDQSILKKLTDDPRNSSTPNINLESINDNLFSEIIKAELLTTYDSLKSMEQEMFIKLGTHKTSDQYKIRILKPLSTRITIMNLNLSLLINLILFNVFAENRNSLTSIIDDGKILLHDQLLNRKQSLEIQLRQVNETISRLQESLIDTVELFPSNTTDQLVAYITAIRSIIVELNYDEQLIQTNPRIQALIEKLNKKGYTTTPEWLLKLIDIAFELGCQSNPFIKET